MDIKEIIDANQKAEQNSTTKLIPWMDLRLLDFCKR